MKLTQISPISSRRPRDHFVFLVSLLVCTFISLVFLEFLSARYRPTLVQEAVVKSTPASQTGATATPVPARAEKYLLAEAALLGVTDNVSYYFKDLSSATGEETSLQPSRSWIPASTIKAYVAIEAFRQARLGLIDFDQMVTIRAQNVVPTELETDEFPRLREGVSVSLRQLVEAMIEQSDNIAYNTLLDLLDRRSINNTLHDLGLTESVVGQKLNLDDSQAAVDINVPGYQPNTTTAKDFASLFNLLYAHQIPGSEEILAIFKRQKINSMIPALLPQDTAVAHKTGDWAPIYHDGGIVYKPQDPFILTIFTNSGNPNVLANLARVAYFRNAAAIGVTSAPKVTAQNSYPTVYLAQADLSSVLGAAATPADKFPTITASDLGITEADLTTDIQDAVKIKPALITPSSFFYGLKRFWEDLQYRLATTTDQKADVLLSQSLARLSEARFLYNQKRPAAAAVLLDQSQTTLAQAAALSKTATSADQLLIKTKQVNDLQFATLATVTNQTPDAAKEQLVDTIYRLYQKNQATVAPAVKSSPISNPTAQKPATLTVTNVSSGKITVQTDDGRTKEMLVSDLTPVRQFHTMTITGPESITVGEKIAVVGKTDSAGQIIPQFILGKLPRELPSRISGTVLEVNPEQNLLKIRDSSQRQITVLATPQTISQSSQTSVSLSGIRAGSQVVVYTADHLVPPSGQGVASGSASPAPAAPTATVNTSKVPITNSTTPAVPTLLPPPTGKPAVPTPAVPPPAPVTVAATTITVTKNSSGKEEKTDKKPPVKSKPAGSSGQSPSRSNNNPGPNPANLNRREASGAGDRR